jgi:hypothetical protein
VSDINEGNEKIMMKAKRTQEQIDYQGRVAELGCLLCREQGRGIVAANLHHIREGQGIGQRASHWLVTPLCRECHQGKNGLHGDQSLMRISKLSELDLLAMTIERMHR